MTDFQRRLRDLGGQASDEVASELRPRAEALRRIGRRRAALSTGVLACLATVVAATAFAFGAGDRGPGPADGPPTTVAPPPDSAPCLMVPIEPTYVPEGFSAEPVVAEAGVRPGLLATFRSSGPASIEVTTADYALFQTRPRPIEVLGAAGTIGLIHEGYSVEFHHGECEYVLNGYGVTKNELKRFATGLEPVLGLPPTGPARLVWPEDTERDARSECRGIEPVRPAPALLANFAFEVLGWESPVYRGRGGGAPLWRLRPTAPDRYAGDIRAGVEVSTVEVRPGCWSIGSVSPLGDRRATGVGVSVDGDVVRIGYDPHGATSATIQFGYGARVRSILHRRGLGMVQVRLGYLPETTGHVLILLRDHDGKVFSAYGVPLPAGDFTAS